MKNILILIFIILFAPFANAQQTFNSLSVKKLYLSEDYPDVRPSLVLDFTSGKLDSRLTFSRASTATYVSSRGLIATAAINEPRFDYDPTTLEPKGLLIEEAGINLSTYSEQLDNAAWTKIRATVSANIAGVVAPDGTATADKLVEDSTAANNHTIQQSFSATSGTSSTVSIFAKLDTTNARSRFRIRIAGAAFIGDGYFDVSAGSVVTNTGSSVASIKTYPNGWYRCSVVTSHSVTESVTARLELVSTGTTTSYNGDGSSGIILWGHQPSTGSFPTSYIKTEASTVSRSQDVATMIGINFSSWYNPIEGSYLVKGSAHNYGAGITMATISDGTNDNRANIAASSSGIFSANIVSGGVTSALISSVAPVSEGDSSMSILGYKLDDFKLSLNGELVVSDTSGSVPVSPNSLKLLSSSAGTVYSGHISQFYYYPKLLTDTELRYVSSPSGFIGSNANQSMLNGMTAIEKIRSIVSVSVSASEALTENDDNFVTSCTNADPSVCTLMTGYFPADPKCWANPIVTSTIAIVTGDTNTTVTVDRTDASTAFTLFCHGVKSF